MEKGISKRNFIKYGMMGMAGIFCCPGRLTATSGSVENLNKHTREAQFYLSTPRGVRCMICPNECTLKEGELSECRNRIAKNDKLYTIAYGNPCAVHVDPIEKKPLYHFLPESKAFSIATAGCNLACLNCQNYTISQTSPTKTRNYDLLPEKVVKQAIANNCKSIAYTYSEPITFFEYTYDTAQIARNKGIKNVLVSAGYINEEPLRKLAKVIDAANIDLKSFDDSIYLKLNAGKLQPILNTLKILKEAGVWLEITNLVVPGWTDSEAMITEMCQWLHSNGFDDVPLHFSRFQPMYKLTQLPPTPVSILRKARKIALNEGLHHVYIGNVPHSGAESTHCARCNQVIIERKGYRILNKNLTDGRCNNCNTELAGVWN